MAATRWGCAGAGKISHDFFTSINSNLPATEHEFVGVASRDQSNAQAFADKLGFKKAYGSYDDLANDPDIDVVYIGTIHVTHVELSIKMLEAGKHVMCEKPMAMNLKQAKTVFETAKKHNRTFVEAIWTHWFPVYDQVRRELAAGSLGEVNLVHASLCYQIVDVPRLRENKLGGGGLLDLGVYPITLACIAYDKMPESITAVAHMSEGNEVDISGCILLKYKGGAMATLSYHCDAEGDNTASILGSTGKIEIPAQFISPTKVTTPSGSYEFPLAPGDYVFSPGHAGMHYEADAMRKTILSGKLENDLVSWSKSEIIMSIMDEVRRQIGLKYPDFDD